MQDQTEEHKWVGVPSALALAAHFIFAEGRWRAWTALLLLGSVVAAVLTNDTLLLILPLQVGAMVFIAWGVFMPASMIADSLTDWLISKIIKQPDPSKVSHRVIYFGLSLLSIAPALYFIGIGGFPGEYSAN